MDSLFPSVEELKEMMHLASRRATWIIFVVPVLFLLAIGFVADRTTTNFAKSEHWVTHTHEVQTSIERLRANILMAQDSRKGYVLTGDERSLAGYSQATRDIPGLVKELRDLTIDNPSQQARVSQLEQVIQNKLATLRQSIDLKERQSEETTKQIEITQSNEKYNDDMSQIFSGMMSEENGLLAERTLVSENTYRHMRIALGVAFVGVVLFLMINFARLLVELRNRMRAEAAVRRLSGRILHLQDMERRKIARELHDGVGQYFASSKMAVDGVLLGESLSDAQKNALSEASSLLEAGIAEARTLSHLLHPPLLDEVGFRAAAEWYISGFSQRSKIKVKFTAPAKLESMAKDIELVLFRVLQEGLTNIHRHAASAVAEVRIYPISNRITMEIEDKGKGISQSYLADFRKSVGTGVGLAGMRERLTEFQGKLQIESQVQHGTIIKVDLPLLQPEFADSTAAGPPSVQTDYRLSAEKAPGTGNGLQLATAPS